MTPTLARPHCEADAAEPRRVRLGGDWTLSSALEVAEQLRTLPDAVDQLDATGIDRIDSAGVLQLMRFAKRRGMELSDIAFRTDHQALVSTIEDVADDRPPRKRDYGVLAALSRLGQRVHEFHYIGLVRDRHRLRAEIRLINIYISKDPSNTAYYGRLCDVYAKLGEKKNALEAARMAYKLEPTARNKVRIEQLEES